MAATTERSLRYEIALVYPNHVSDAGPVRDYLLERSQPAVLQIPLRAWKLEYQNQVPGLELGFKVFAVRFADMGDPGKGEVIKVSFRIADDEHSRTNQAPLWGIDGD